MTPFRNYDWAEQNSYSYFGEEEAKAQRDEMVHPNSHSWQGAEPGLAKFSAPSAPTFLYHRPYCFLKINWGH